MKLGNLQCVTTAPEAYDYGWATTVIDNLYVTDSGKVMRLVQNEDQWHFNEQMKRYSSGGNLTISNQIQLDEFLTYGWIKPTEDPRPIYREYFDFEDLLTEASNEDIQRILDCVEEIQKMSEVKLEVKKGGYAYSLEIIKDKDLFDLVKAKLNSAIIKSVA
jgi:hypothetical protein